MIKSKSKALKEGANTIASIQKRGTSWVCHGEGAHKILLSLLRRIDQDQVTIYLQ
jgi:hypothetical protein